MASTTLAAILASWDTRLQASPLSLVPAIAPFTHDAQPGGAVANSYWIEDGGNVSRTSVTNRQEVRVDRVTLWAAKPLNFVGPATLQAMEDLADSVYRSLLVLATAAGYNLIADTRRVTVSKESELLVASLAFLVDFDFDASTT